MPTSPLRAAVLGACLSLAPAMARADTVTVFAASSLQEVLAEVAAQIQRDGRRVRLVFAATSTLARQIGRGAPADIFVAAHPRWMRWLGAQSAVQLTRQTTILSNRLALIALRTSQGRPRRFRDVDLPAMLGDRRLAVGDPAHVPVGIYARAALRHQGLWKVLQGRLARTHNTRAAVALVARGEAPFGIVYRSDALAEKRLRIVALFPAASHPPIRYQAALVGAEPTTSARAFFNRLVADAAAGRFARLGFDAPGQGVR